MTDEEKVYELKEKIRNVFKELRREGYLARMNYLCCGTCACSSLPSRSEELEKNGKEIKGVIFYHEQSEEGLWDYGNVCIYFGTHKDQDDMRTTDRKMGEYLVNKFKDAGVDVEWDGSPRKAIQLYAYRNEPIINMI